MMNSLITHLTSVEMIYSINQQNTQHKNRIGHNKCRILQETDSLDLQLGLLGSQAAHQAGAEVVYEM